MSVVKYEEGVSKGAPHPQLYYDGITKEGYPILKQRTSTSKGFDKIHDNDKTPMNELIDYDKANKMAKETNNHRWMANTKRNSKNYPDMGNEQSLERYNGYLTNKSAIMIGAGPSLKKNGHLLKKTDITKIAMLHALPYLDSIGVIPEFVVHSDALSDDKVFVTESSKDITLIAHTFVAPALLRKWKGEVSFFRGMPIDPYGERLHKESTADTTIKPMGCSMAAAVSIVDQLMNANTLILVGNDLAYSKDYDKDKETHVWDGLPYNNNEVAGIPALEAEGVFPGEMKKRIKTCYSFIQYRHILMQYAQNRVLQFPFRRYINATEGGILLLPETMTLKKALKSVEDTTYNVNAA